MSVKSYNIADAIREAILLGSVKDIDAVLAEPIPDNLRYGLEALRHFRAFYGVGSEHYPQDELAQKTAILMESAWGAELLGMLKNDQDILQKQA